jgi:hypothetical protein
VETLDSVAEKQEEDRLEEEARGSKDGIDEAAHEEDDATEDLRLAEEAQVSTYFSSTCAMRATDCSVISRSRFSTASSCSYGSSPDSLHGTACNTEQGHITESYKR